MRTPLRAWQRRLAGRATIHEEQEWEVTRRGPGFGLSEWARKLATASATALMVLLAAPPGVERIETRALAPAVMARGQGDQLPAGLSREGWSQIRGAMEASSYHATPVSRSGQKPALVAANRQQRYRTTFRPEGIEIVSSPASGKDWRLAVSVTGFGHAGDLHRVPVSEPQAQRGRVEYRRGPVTEWYENRPGGLEQGFTIGEAPAGGDGPLALELAVEGGLSVSVEGLGPVLAAQLLKRDPAFRLVSRFGPPDDFDEAWILADDEVLPVV